MVCGPVEWLRLLHACYSCKYEDFGEFFSLFNKNNFQTLDEQQSPWTRCTPSIESVKAMLNRISVR